MKYLDIVHLVDTEGPINEPLSLTFKRIKEIFGLQIKPSKKNLNKILNKEIQFKLNKKLEKKFYEAFNRKTLSYKKNWKDIQKENRIIFSKKFRSKFKDSLGKYWKINWNCVDHVNFLANPQGRSLGYHKIFDYYKNIIKKTNISDSLHFHFHPTSIKNFANTTGNHYFSNSNNLYQILCRRIIDRSWFPSVYRPGFHIENPDSNWFLEQFIPFDYSNQSCDQINLNNERFENWNYAPRSWKPYHPSHDDYQKIGKSRRWIARCLNVGTRIALLTQKEVDKAFLEKKKNTKTILAFTNHDFRFMEKDFENVYKMLKKSSQKYKIKFRFSDARDAFRNILKPSKKKLRFQIKFKKNKIFISSNKDIFGPQPFLAIKTKNKKYFHENFFIKKPFREWIYTFDRHNVDLIDLDTFGFAANDRNGATSLVKISFIKKSPKIKQFNF